MNSQPARPYPDARIDQVLHALRTTEPPAGLEERVAQRIAARIAQAAEARALNPSTRIARPSSLSARIHPTSVSLFAVILTLSTAKGKDPRILLAPAAQRYATATALTLLVALTTFTLLHHHTPPTTAHAPSRVPHLRDGILVAKVGSPMDALSSSEGNVGIAPSTTAPPSREGTGLQQSSVRLEGAGLQSSSASREGTGLQQSNASFEGAGLQSRRNTPTRNAALAAEGISHSQSTSAPQPDPDAIALAETLAPSRPAPPMPLTPQEHLILAATRPGQPIQLAELDIARAPNLRAAARRSADMEHYVKSLLAPFAVADALSPTTFSQPQETSTPTPPSPSSN